VKKAVTNGPALAVVESAMGHLYLAVLISRLVGFSTSGDAKLT
jgi:hypothetical protein